MHYTPQQIPGDIEQALRARAAAEHKSVDAALIDALARGLGVEQPQPVKRRELSDVAGRGLTDDEMQKDFEAQRRDLAGVIGTWESDPDTEAILEEQNRIDPELWK